MDDCYINLHFIITSLDPLVVHNTVVKKSLKCDILYYTNHWVPTVTSPVVARLDSFVFHSTRQQPVHIE